MTLLCWLLGHEPTPKWDDDAAPWCRRCERYVPSEECRGPVWKR